MTTLLPRLCLAGLIFLLCVFPVSSVARDMNGVWQGRLQAGGLDLRLVITIADVNGVLSATMDSPDQGVTGIPVTTIAVRNDSLLFSVERIRGAYAGAITSGGETITGSWTQGSVSIPLVLRHTDKAVQVQRPQQPQPPYPYVEEQVTFANPRAAITLAGTLTRPQSAGPFPAVVLISGSGPQDRNSTILGHQPFLVLADYLTRRGIAVLRYDERGVGASGGTFATATSEDFADDVRAAVAYLAGRSDIDARRIGLIGHSEGGIVAPMVAASSSDVAFLVLLAAPGMRGEELLYRQAETINRTAGMSEELITANRALQRRMFGAALQSRDSATLHVQLAALLDSAQGREKELIATGKINAAEQAAALSSPWLRFFLAYDPAPTLRNVRVPVLALNGGKDVQVPADDNLKAVGRALREGGNKAVTTKELPGLNHLFQTATTGLPVEYGSIAETFSPAALEMIGEWIHKRVD